jgi:DNA polymerase-3 subunit alpha
VIEALILAGALDSIEGRREQKLAALDLALARAQRLARDRTRGQASLFGTDASTTMGESSVLPDAPEWEHRERLLKEREFLGVYLSGHPLDSERLLLDALRPARSADTPAMEVDRFVALCGMVTGTKMVISRANQTLLNFLQIEDLSGSVEVLAIGDAYERNRAALTSDRPVVVLARTSRRENDEMTKLILEKAITLDEAVGQLVRGVRLQIPVTVSGDIVDRVLECIAEHPGSCPLQLDFVDGDQTLTVAARRASVAPTGDLLYALSRVLGDRAVKIDAVAVNRLTADLKAPAWRAAKARAG